jgi:hypothetical protein
MFQQEHYLYSYLDVEDAWARQGAMDRVTLRWKIRKIVTLDLDKQKLTLIR